MKGLIYKITNKTNQKFYVGKTTKTLNQRLSGHFNFALKKIVNHIFIKQ